MPRVKYVVDMEELFEYITDRIRDGKTTAMKAIAEYGELSDLPESKVRQTYYKMRAKSQRSKLSEGNVISVIPESNESKSDIMTVLSGIIEMSEKAEVNLEPILEALLPLFKAAVKSDDNAKIETLEFELSLTKTKCENLTKEVMAMKKHVVKLDNYLDDFLHLPSLKKIGNLEDFTNHLKILVDGSGIVQSVEELKENV